ncbi:MAG: efflux RND transporter periplasmic adaptor subunit [Lentisphaeria bacterium]|nr:efflux RND transporter periplasmic adaptor subunit [Lentisphaeria bacterium]
MKTKKIVAVILLLLILGWLGYRIYVKIEEKQSANSKKSSAFALPIETVMPTRQNIRDMRFFTGSLEAIATYNVASKVNGYWVKQGKIEIGSPLKPNDFIGKIDDVEYKQNYEQAKANYEVTIAELAEANAILELRKREYQRQKELGRITSKASLETAEYSMKSQEATVKVKQAEVLRETAELEIAKIQLNDTVITNLITDEASRCFVSEKLVNIGDLVSPNQVVLKVADIGKLKAKINIIEKDYPFLSIGQRAEISTDAYPGKTFIGKIENISQTLNKSSRQATAEIVIENHSLELKPGMFVRVYLDFGKHDNAQMLPRNALVTQHDQSGVFCVDKETETVKFVPVKTGIVINDMVEILEPAEINSQVATLGNHLLVDGAKVLISNANKKNEADK